MKTKDTALVDWPLFALAACALAVTTLVIRREFWPAAPAQELPLETGETLLDTRWRELKASGHWMGPANASVVFVEFSDFQCPSCRSWANTLHRLASERPTTIALVYHHMPLSDIHPEAMGAAIASECAAREGKFKEYHDFLFRHQEELSDSLYVDAADSVGIHADKAFRSCLDGEETRHIVEQDSRTAGDLKITGTPAVWVNGRRLNRVPDTVWVDRAYRSRNPN